MELSKINRVYFIGIGGIGMSALARYFAKRGCVVCGYDKTRTNLTIALENEGILISYLDDESVVPVSFMENHPDTLVVYTPAIPKNAQILNHFKENGFSLKKRSEVLGIISRGMFCIAVAGTQALADLRAVLCEPRGRGHLRTEVHHPLGAQRVMHLQPLAKQGRHLERQSQFLQ